MPGTEMTGERGRKFRGRSSSTRRDGASVAKPSWHAAAWTAGVILSGFGGAPVVAQDASWAEAVRGDDWGDERFTSDGDMIIVRRAAAKGPEGRPRLKLRYEYRDGVRLGDKTYRSMLAGPWQTPLPNTVDAKSLAVACAGR